MAASSVFPVLRLPILAVQEVMSMMIPFALINFSLTSLKAKRVMNSVSKHKSLSRYGLKLDFDSELTLAFKGTEVVYRYEITSEKDYDGLVNEGIAFDDDDDILEYRLHKYSEDRVTELLKYAEYAVRNFNCEVIYVSMSFDELGDQNKSIIDWMKTHVKFIPTCNIMSEKVSDEYAAYFLDNVAIEEEIDIQVKMRKDARLNLPKNASSIRVHDSKFVTVEDLMKLNFVAIMLCHTGISNQEFNLFLKNWMSSKSNVKLRIFQAFIENEKEAHNIIFDLPHKRSTFSVDRGFHITRNDGATAIVYFKREWGHTNLVMIVH